jgi:very-short-patch-repair endonuclease
LRYNINRKHSTRGERIVYEVLKELHIPFKHRWLVNGREIDFIFLDVALEVNGHEQNAERNQEIAASGYRPIHISNEEVSKEYITNLIKSLHGNNHNIPRRST